MDCCPSHDPPEAGYATPAALVMALALSLVAVAMVGRSVMLLRLARADITRTGVEAVLDGAQLQAAAVVIRAGSGGPYRWALPTDLGFAEALVESEGDKLAPAAGSRLPEAVFAALGVTDAPVLKAKLAAAATLGVDVAALDAAPLWRECAASLISGLGQRHEGAPPPPVEPSAVPVLPGGLPDPPDWRVGEVWRIRITTAAGWRDDRIVRFTGDARHPVAVVQRRLSRSDGGQGRCDAVLAAAA